MFAYEVSASGYRLDSTDTSRDEKIFKKQDETLK